MENDACNMELEACGEELDLSLNDSKRMLGTLFRLFPVILNVAPSPDWLSANLVRPFVVRSENFCKPKKGIKIDKSAAGGFSVAGSPKTSGKGFRLKQISFDHNGGWKVYWTETFAKVTHDVRSEILASRKEGNSLVLTDPLYEGIASSFISNLYDMGVLPYFSKVFGSELCPVRDNRYAATVIMEKSGVPMKKLITNGKFSGATKGDFAIWMCEYVSSIDNAKRAIGLHHSDVHMDNVLLKKVGSPTEYFGGEVSRAMCDGKYYDETKYIIHEIPGMQKSFFVVENNGLIPKVIDYGLTIVKFGDSDGRLYPELKAKNFVVSNTVQTYSKADNCVAALSNQGGLVNFETIFFLLNFVFETEKARRGVYKNATQYDPEILEFVTRFLIVLGVDIARLQTIFLPKLKKLGEQTTVEGAQRLWFSDRNVGIDNGIYPSFALASLLPKVSLKDKTYYIATRNSGTLTERELVAIINDQKTMYVPCLPSARIASSNTEYKFRTDIAKFAQQCANTQDLFLFGEGYGINKGDKMQTCATKLVSAMKEDSEFLLPKITRIAPSLSDVVPFATPDSLVYESKACLVFSKALFPPLQQRIKDIFTFEPYQRTLNYLPPAKKIVGKTMRTVRVSLVVLKPTARCSMNLGLDLQDALVESTLKNRDAFSVNGGYFVVPQNIQNPLTPGLEGKEYAPIGYYYDGTRNSGTVLPVPPGYRNWFASVLIKKGKMSLVHLPEFEAKHKMTNVPFNIRVGNTTSRQSQSVIALDSRGKPQTTLKYDSCFSTGPILIWEGRRIFNKDVMLKEKFSLSDGTEYKILWGAKNTNKFFSEPGESSFPYGQRHSANFQIHNILLEFKDGTFGFFFVEGRGYDALGLERLQVARLIMRLFPGTIKNAVSLDGGFSANAVFASGGVSPQWLLPDPEKRKLGTSLFFSV